MKSFRSFRRKRHIIIVLLIVCFIGSLPSISTWASTLRLQQQIHVLGGDRESSVHYGGSGLLSAAWSGSIYAIAYPDYTLVNEDQGLFLALVDSEGKTVVDPIRLSKAKKVNSHGFIWYQFSSFAKIFWDESAFLILHEKENTLSFLRISPSGQIVSETTSDLSLDPNTRFHSVMQNRVISVVKKQESNSVVFQKFSNMGEKLGEPVVIQTQGDMENATFLNDGMALLTRLQYSGSSNKVLLECFYSNGEKISLPYDIGNVSMTPFGALHWNGNELISLVGNSESKGGVTVRSYRFDHLGQPIGTSQIVGTIPSEAYYGSVNFDTELIWTGSQYLAVWDQGTPNQGSMEDVYVRLLNSIGEPISDALKLNSQPLDQANNGSCFTENGFAVFSVEKGNKSPSMTYSKLLADPLDPAFTPTPIPSETLPTSTRKPLFELPRGPYLLWEGTLTNPFRSFIMTIQGATVEVNADKFGSTSTTTAQFSEPLPDTPVDVVGKLMEGNVSIDVVEQPRSWNDYTAKIALTAPVFSQGGKQKILISWEAVVPEATPTPWPSWDVSAPSPTPRDGESKVLWIARKDTFPNTDSSSFRFDYTEFGKIFEKLGTTVEWIVAGEQTITDALLSGYGAVVFADIRKETPLTVEEQGSVVRYVRSGGSIFIIGQQDSGVLLEESALYATSVTQPFGIRFSTSTSGKFHPLVTHSLLYGIQELSPAGMGSKLLVAPPAKAIAGIDNGDVILAIAEDGYGRVVAYSDEYLFYSGEMNNNSNGNVYRQFAKNIACWMLHKEDRIDATPTPPATPYIVLNAKMRTTRGLLVKIQGQQVSWDNSSDRSQAELLSSSFMEPLPSYPVDISVELALGDASVIIQQQPRPWNHYTATFILNQPHLTSREPASEQYVVITWSREISIDPTPTPFPGWDSNSSTPTPISGNPKILWITNSGDNPDADQKYDPELSEFSDMFYALGADMTVLEAGKQTITRELLHGYQAIVFGKTYKVPPLTGPEIESVVEFVRGGGSIFVMGEQTNPYTLDASALYATSITKLFGIQFSTTISGTYRDFVRHRITSEVSVTSGIGGCILLTESPAYALGYAQGGEVILAAAEDGFGRVVAYSDEVAFSSATAGIPGNNLEIHSHKRLASNIAAWLLHKDDTIPPLSPEPTATPTFLPGPTSEETSQLIQRVLKVNEPWLNPKAIKASYSLQVSLGNEESFSVAEGGNAPLRVGSIIWTPLHVMFNKNIPYTVETIGKTTFNDIPVVALNVTFDASFQEQVGFGGQGSTSYSSRGIRILSCRLLIEPEKALPLFIGTSTSTIWDGQLHYTTTWTFDANFFEVGGGYAPRSLISEHLDSFNEKQTFQIQDSVWIFSSGNSWNAEKDPLGQSGEILTVTLTNLVIEDPNYVMKNTSIKTGPKQ